MAISFPARTSELLGQSRGVRRHRCGRGGPRVPGWMRPDWVGSWAVRRGLCGRCSRSLGICEARPTTVSRRGGSTDWRGSSSGSTRRRVAARTLCWGLEGAGCGWGVGPTPGAQGKGPVWAPICPTPLHLEAWSSRREGGLGEGTGLCWGLLPARPSGSLWVPSHPAPWPLAKTWRPSPSSCLCKFLGPGQRFLFLRLLA